MNEQKNVYAEVKKVAEKSERVFRSALLEALQDLNDRVSSLEIDPLDIVDMVGISESGEKIELPTCGDVKKKEFLAEQLVGVIWGALKEAGVEIITVNASNGGVTVEIDGVVVNKGSEEIKAALVRMLA